MIILMCVEMVLCTVFSKYEPQSSLLISFLAVQFGLGKHLIATDPITGYKILQVSTVFLLHH